MNPKLALREINRLYFRFFSNFVERNAVSITDEEWDNLIILDGCRYDTFEEFSDLEGTLRKTISGGTHTVEFLEYNFGGGIYHDTVYITANPQLHRNRDTINCEFHDEFNIWSDNGWDDEFGTVLPETVTKRAINIAEQYPNKRLIVHYVQPHFPFITDDVSFDKGHLETKHTDSLDFWSQIFMGNLSVSKPKIEELYENNLKIALPHVKTLISELDGLSVVTSDHGNMIGETARPLPITEWGHPRGIHTKPLVEVPWHECGYERRKQITGEDSDADPQDHRENVVTERLEHLGYVD